MSDPWSGWEAETVERGSKALNERDQAREALKGLWITVETFGDRGTILAVRAFMATCDVPLPGAPLEATE